MPVTRPEPRYDVFISYRRGTADELALLLQTHLQRHGVAAFLDRDLRHGVFDDMLLRRIAEAPTFLIILTPNTLDRCTEEEDWLRREIVQAIGSERNIIPLQVDSFQFTAEVVRTMDTAIRELSRYHAVEYSRTYLESTIERIVKIVEEDRAERKEAEAAAERRRAAERIGAEKNERKKAEAEQQTQQRSQTEAQTVAKPERLEREPRVAGRPGANEEAWIGKPKKEGADTESRTPGRWLRLRKGLSAGSIVAIMAALVVVGGLWLLPSSGSRPPSGETVKINSKDGQKYVWIPPGMFQMGCSAGNTECDTSEKPAHAVTITKGFWLGQTPVTQAAYQRVEGRNPSYFKGDQRPVETVSWDDAVAYCSAAGMRLPTEAEWEYAARAGSTESQYGDIDAIAWYYRNSENQTHPVGQKQANAWKLYDMLGNVWQWTADWYDGNYYTQAPSQDPRGPSSGKLRVLRGGAWDEGCCRNLAADARVRAWDRATGVPGARDHDTGFRCAGESKF